MPPTARETRTVNLSELVRDLPVEGDTDADVTGVAIDSRKIQEGELFVARRGEQQDGHAFLPDAVEAGASALLVESDRRDGLEFDEAPPNSVPVLTTPDTREILPSLLERFYGNPSEDLVLVGVTGTNGKTTTTYLLHAILEAAGHATGLIGTIERRFEGDERPLRCTTPSLVEAVRCLREWSRSGASAAVMEVSSHGLDQGRVRSLRFTAAGFTNLSQDHLDYHGDMENYYRAKRRLFDLAHHKVSYADDEYGDRLARETGATTVGRDADYTVRDPRVALEGIELGLTVPSGTTLELYSPLTGLFNYKNIAIAAAMALEIGLDPEAVQEGIRQCDSVPGRCERLPGPPPAVVDYAHTPDAMRNVLESLRPLVDGELICVFGAGGDRDVTKRPRMGRIAASQADYAVVTSDNPRTESPEAIIDDILTGMDGHPNYHVQEDRGQAIREGLERAGPDDLVLIVGKGHETEQVYGDRVIPFDDREVTREVQRHLNRSA